MLKISIYITKGFYKICIFLIIFIFSVQTKLISQNNYPQKPLDKKNMSNSSALPSWAFDATIYEVNIRQYTPEGTIKAFTAHLPRLHKMGIKILWLMPIFPISHNKRKGTLGSYYAVSDYYAINPEFGEMTDLDALVTLAHQLDIKVILDWVPNHTGYDHVWINSHPRYYTLNKQGEPQVPRDKSGKLTDWTDVAELNYENMELRQAMLDALLYWVQKHHIDGFRFDMAELVPLDFWHQVYKSLSAYNCFLIGESQDPSYFDRAFQVQYGWSFHHLMKDIAMGKTSPVALDKLVKSNITENPSGAVTMQFIDNHDENSWQQTMRKRFGPGYKTFGVLAFTLPGIPLMYSGQESDLNKSLRFFEKDTIDFGNFPSQRFYHNLIELKKNNQALWSNNTGEYKYLNTSKPEHVFAFRRDKEANSVIIITNLSGKLQHIKLDKSALSEKTYVKDFTSGKKLLLYPEMEITLGPWDYKIYSYTKK